jgi:hypothetical protein
VPDWKKKRRSIAPPVMCKCGVEASYGLVHSGLGIGHFCGHMFLIHVSSVSSVFRRMLQMFHLNVS